MSSVAVAVFPELGNTVSRPSRVVPGALSPFASIAEPVPAPGRRAYPEDLWPPVEAVVRLPESDVPAEPAPDLAAIKAEAAAEGYADGYGEGLERGEREGLERGFEQGRRDAMAQELAQRQLAIDNFANALQAKVDDLNRTLPSWYRRREEAMADLAIDVVRRLLNHELSLSRDSALAIAQEALAEVTHATHARIRMNPLDIPGMEQHRSLLIAASASLRNIDLIEDPAIRGGCVIETDGGVVDSTIDTRLSLLEETWRQAA